MNRIIDRLMFAMEPVWDLYRWPAASRWMDYAKRAVFPLWVAIFLPTFMFIFALILTQIAFELMCIWAARLKKLIPFK